MATVNEGPFYVVSDNSTKTERGIIIKKATGSADFAVMATTKSVLSAQILMRLLNRGARSDD